jgi:hypothetical protein
MNLTLGEEMDNGKFWYYLGLICGGLFRGLIFALVVFGFVWNVWHRELPFLPVILFLTYQIWVKIYVVYEAVIYLAQNPPKDTLNPTEIEKLINLINFKNLNGGGPN